MALKETTKKLKTLLAKISNDLEKSEKGNKAAGQRTRTGTIELAKLAKIFRAESIAANKAPKAIVKKTKTYACPPPSPQVKRATAKLPARKK